MYKSDAMEVDLPRDRPQPQLPPIYQKFIASGWQQVQQPVLNTPPYSINLINNQDTNPIYTSEELHAETNIIVGQPVDIRC